MAAIQVPTSADTTDAHPLDPLGAQEIAATTEALRRERILTDDTAVVSVTLIEPAKDVVLAYQPGHAVERRASAVLRDRARAVTIEAVVSLTRGVVEEHRDLEGVQPPYNLQELIGAIEAVEADPRWQDAMRARGITDLSLASIDPWPAGYYGPEYDPGDRRLALALTWVRSTEDGNAYARPIEGLIVTVDLDRLEVVRVEDHGAVPVPPRSGDYWPEAISDPGNYPAFPGTRDDLRPISITQPEGVSFTIDGHEVTWHKWRFRVGFTHREGLVLHTVAFDDRGRWRPVLHRGSLCEMVVPYGDPSPTHRRKNAFDVGEAGFGWLANSLELGCDCLGEIRYMDAVIADPSGEPRTLTNAICLHEEDFSLAWKHVDFHTGRTEVRRRRRFVISQISTLGNYEYGLYWYLYEDGTIEVEVKSTGIVSTGAVPPGEDPDFGTLIAPGLYAPNHQHFFCFRLDVTVDGVANSVYEVESQAAAPGENPHGNAWRVVERPLTRESEAQRRIAPLAGRYWRVTNPGSTNALGQPVGYRLLPGENVAPFFTEDSAIAARATFATQHLWVTPFAPDERYAAGDYPFQHPGGDGLPRYTEADRSLEETDLVLWYVAGAHHPPRPEDWPVMPATSVSFRFQPHAFFDGNPALDLPRPDEACHHH